ncbi:type II secretion system protein F [Glaciihabitans arcticus]|uniref:Type II secretion system protein F n=1 Tax=Glaciihabitans arcticus TaxID=2668039 RepID=A0A4Q9GWZ2_9MICO|nr:type II secretion system F family protein [Glaciihabitans arcticus]TBN57243.1 type II secretion system protein F [Glaciihabitans arcticus]
MSVLWGAVLGAGALLAVSPVLWPAGAARAPRRPGVVAGARVRLLQAGLGRVSVAAFAVASTLLGLVVGAVTFVFLPVTALAIAAALVALVLPGIIVAQRARARRRATRVVWPDVVDHLVSAVRSGLALPDSVVTLARSGPPETRSSFARFEEEYRASGNFGLCLTQLKERLADPVSDRILETLRMSREVGGSELTLVLRNLAAYLRQEAAIRSEVEARQSWVLNAARLGVAAPWIVLLLLASRPEAAAAYNTAGGGLMIVVGLAVTVVAYRLMIGLGRMPEERRWFE